MDGYLVYSLYRKFILSELVLLPSFFKTNYAFSEVRFVFTHNMSRNEKVKIKSSFIDRDIRISVIPEKDTQKGKMKNTKAQNCKRCENVEM